MISSCGSIAGVLPSCLMTTTTSTHGFALVKDPIRLSLTNPGVATSTHPKYIAYCYDTLKKLTLNHTYAKLILNRGLTLYPEVLGIQLWSKQYSSRGDLIDSKTMENIFLFAKISSYELFPYFYLQSIELFWYKGT